MQIKINPVKEQTNLQEEINDSKPKKPYIGQERKRNETIQSKNPEKSIYAGNTSLR
jgi:hypothetical protein